MKTSIRILPPLAAAASLLFFVACSAQTPKAVSTALSSAIVLHANDRIEVRVSSSTTNILLPDDDSARVAGKILRRFEPAGATAETSANRYRVEVAITDYNNGNDYVPAMVAGLNEISTNAEVRIISLPGDTLVSRFKVSQVYPVTGVYGSASHIDAIEDLFAQSVADALAGRSGQQQTASSDS